VSATRTTQHEPFPLLLQEPCSGCAHSPPIHPKFAATATCSPDRSIAPKLAAAKLAAKARQGQAPASTSPLPSSSSGAARAHGTPRHRPRGMRGQRVARPSRGFKSRGRLPGSPLLLLLASRHQHSRKIRLLRSCNPLVARTKAVAARAPMVAGGGEGPRAPGGGAAGLAVWATLLCNAASLAYLLRSYLVDGRRRGCAVARSAVDDGAIQPEDEGALLLAEDEEAPDRDAALPPDAVLNLELGDPTMYEAFWLEVGARAATVIRGWDATSYFSDAAALCWFLEPGLEREVRRLHRVVGNAAADDGYHLVVGTGATQLYQAAMYALSSTMARRDTPVPVVSPAPYYSVGAGEGPGGGEEDGLLRRPEHHRRVQGIPAARHQDPRGGLGRLRVPHQPPAPASLRCPASSTSRGGAWRSAGARCATPWRLLAPSACRRRQSATANSTNEP
ncbi:unnamed protein product, partial [Urochloa humidicola]